MYSIALFTVFKQESEIHFNTSSLTRSTQHHEFCINIILKEIPVMSKFSSHTQLGDRIHNAGLDYYTFHLHLKKCLNSGSHSTCNITAITLLAGISGITASTQDLLHMLFGFHQRVGCGCRGKLWFMFEYKTCLYFPKGTNNKGLEQAKEYVRINELLLCIIKLLRTGPGSFW